MENFFEVHKKIYRKQRKEILKNLKNTLKKQI